jgi:hypothetical protein
MYAWGQYAIYTVSFSLLMRRVISKKLVQDASLRVFLYSIWYLIFTHHYIYLKPVFLGVVVVTTPHCFLAFIEPFRRILLC